MNSRKLIALVATVLLMTVWGSTFLITKTTVQEIPPFTLGVIRFLLAAMVLTPVAIARGALKQLPRPFPFGLLTLLALTGFAGFSAAFNNALRFGSVVQGSLIFALVPAAIGLAAVLILKERLSTRRIAGIALSVGGVAMVVGVGRASAAAPNPMLGALCMVGAVVAWALYTVTAKRAAHLDPLVMIAGASLLGSIFLLPLSALELTRQMPHVTLGGIAGAFFLGVFASGIAYVVYSRILRELDASLVGTLLNIDPIVGVISAVVFLGEALHGWQVVGGLAAFGGMWLASASGADA
ncbi:MAG: DMT family transporter [Gemmatimonadota bacterium]